MGPGSEPARASITAQTSKTMSSSVAACAAQSQWRHSCPPPLQRTVATLPHSHSHPYWHFSNPAYAVNDAKKARKYRAKPVIANGGAP